MRRVEAGRRGGGAEAPGAISRRAGWSRRAEGSSAQQPWLPAAGQEACWDWRRRRRRKLEGCLTGEANVQFAGWSVLRLLCLSRLLPAGAPPYPPPLSLLTTPPAPFAPAPSVLPASPFPPAPPAASPGPSLCEVPRGGGGGSSCTPSPSRHQAMWGGGGGEVREGGCFTPPCMESSICPLGRGTYSLGAARSCPSELPTSPSPQILGWKCSGQGKGERGWGGQLQMWRLA